MASDWLKFSAIANHFRTNSSCELFVSSPDYLFIRLFFFLLFWRMSKLKQTTKASESNGSISVWKRCTNEKITVTFSLYLIQLKQFISCCQIVFKRNRSEFWFLFSQFIKYQVYGIVDNKYAWIYDIIELKLSTGMGAHNSMWTCIAIRRRIQFHTAFLLLLVISSAWSEHFYF